MAVRNDLTVNWDVSPRVITVAAPSTEIIIQDLHDSCRFLESEPSAMDNPILIDTAGKEQLGGGVEVGLTSTLQNALVAFEARSGPTYEQCRVSGGNVISIDTAGNPLFTPISPTAFTQVVVTASSSATTANQAQLEYGTFGGGVHLNTATGEAGTKYPIGTPSRPSDNLSDAKTIATNRGFEVLLIEGTFTFAVDDVLDGFIVQGVSSSKTFINLTEQASITNCIFKDASIDGYLDGGNDASFCVIGNLAYIDGSLLDCFLTAGTITLDGTQANFIRCASAVAGGGVGQTPTIDMGGFGTDLVIRDYQGGIKIINHTSGADDVSIDMSSGRVVLDSTISSGIYTIRGVCSVENNSTGTAQINTFVNLTINDLSAIASTVWSHTQ
jgi:hypothetical protein